MPEEKATNSKSKKDESCTLRITQMFSNSEPIFHICIQSTMFEYIYCQKDE